MADIIIGAAILDHYRKAFRRAYQFSYTGNDKELTDLIERVVTNPPNTTEVRKEILSAMHDATMEDEDDE